MLFQHSKNLSLLKMATKNNISSWALNGTIFGSNDSYLLLNIFPNDVADELFNQIHDEITWNEMKQKGGRVPRDVSIQGTISNQNGDEYEPIYRHPADEQPETISWTPGVLKIKERIEELTQQKLNHVFLQYYRNGKDFIGEHSDKTLDILIDSNILNYSLGAARTMILKHKTQDGLKQRFKLPHNSLFIMGWKTNHEWFHSIKQDNRADRDKESDELAFLGQRISLTLRTVATFRNRRTGQLFGQGARNKTIEQISNESDEQEMLMAFSAENKSSGDFDWNQHYRRGFNALNFKFLNPVVKEEENKD